MNEGSVISQWIAVDETRWKWRRERRNSREFKVARLVVLVVVELRELLRGYQREERVA